MDKKQKNGRSLADRHIGPRPEDIELMLSTLGYSSMTDFVEDVVPGRHSFIFALQFRCGYVWPRA